MYAYHVIKKRKSGNNIHKACSICIVGRGKEYEVCGDDNNNDEDEMWFEKDQLLKLSLSLCILAF